MLYATTRSKVATYTAQRALKEERAPDGGYYVPTAWPQYDREALEALLKEPAAGIVASILNDFFKKDLGKLDVEFALGKRFFGITDISHRIFIGELWRCSDWSFEGVCRRLARRVSSDLGAVEPGAWTRIACRIAMLFAFFGELYKRKLLPWFEEADVAVMTADFEGPFAAHAARKMGLPVGEVICCCNDNGGVWELLNQGQMKLGARVRPTMTPDCDRAVPGALELLIHDRMVSERRGASSPAPGHLRRRCGRQPDQAGHPQPLQDQRLHPLSLQRPGLHGTDGLPQPSRKAAGGPDADGI